MNVSFEILSETKEIKLADKLIKKIWGDENGVTPYLLVAHAHVGGILIGAYEKNELIGISYGFPGIMDFELFFYSQLLGVLPAYRGGSVGLQLKLTQAEVAREKGFKQMKWTFDPLKIKNAYLNIHKLGAKCTTYLPNFYGEMTDTLNEGSPTDRLLMDWDLSEINCEKVPLDLKLHTEIMQIEHDDQSMPICNGWIKTTDELICMAVPTEMQSTKTAQLWRTQTREALVFYFKNNYYITDFHFIQGRSVQYYILHRK